MCTKLNVVHLDKAFWWYLTVCTREVVSSLSEAGNRDRDTSAQVALNKQR